MKEVDQHPQQQLGWTLDSILSGGLEEKPMIN